MLESLAGLLDDADAKRILSSRIQTLPIQLSKPDQASLRTLAEQFQNAGTPWIEALMDTGDEKLALTPDAGLVLHKQAIEDAPRPRLHAEIGFLLLVHSGIDDLPYSEFDFQGEWWPTSKSRGGMNWTESIRPCSELVTPQRLSGTKIPPTARTNALGLALDAYGRAYSYYLANASDLEAKQQPSKGAELDWTELWRQLLVLDGLRVTLLELGRLHEAHLACFVYELWSEAFNDITGGGFEDSQFRIRFAETSGFIRGREVELIVQQAVDEARRKVVVSDPDSFATQVAETVASKLGPVPVASRALIEDELKAKLVQAWTRPSDGVREQIIEAEWLRGILDVHEGRDYTPVVVFYGKALESLLKHVSLSGGILSEFRRQLLDPRVNVHWLPSKAPKQVTDQLVEAIDLRNPAAHGESGPYRPVPRSRMIRMRDLVIGSESEDGIITLLHRHARWQ